MNHSAFVPSKTHHSSSRRTLAHHPITTHCQSPLTTHHAALLTTHQLTTPQLTLSSSLNTDTKEEKIRKRENRKKKKKRRRKERGRKERTMPTRAPPRRPSSLRALTVASASPSRALTIAAQYHHRVCSLSLLSIVVVAQHRHCHSLEKYFLELMKVPRVESKLRVFSFKIQFLSQVTEFKRSLKAVNSACEEVQKSVKLKIMKKILFWVIH
ncbi:uncharacterized protein [Arachis hypogaea]|uniref:uncharacterized protein isoform X1 n=1 Tax=Arachis hypogaea TaxID=3818 RepID=UPI000DEC9C44